jgi:transglutaminase-like putative cysteine protease
MKILHYKLKIVFLLASFFTIQLFQTKTAFATTNFTTDYNVTYAVPEKGPTKATMSVTLTNTTADHYASSYKMKLGFDQVQNLQAKDQLGSIKADLKKVSDGYDLSLIFNKKSVGIGSKHTFTITFETPSILKDSGEIKEINIPGLSDPAQFRNFTVEVKTPPSFGKASFIKPHKNDSTLVFSKDDLGKSGIAIGFGDMQYFDFSLSYHLRNSNLYATKTEIALPPDTNYQKVYITDISPRPSNVRVDEDGNWLAEYALRPAKKVDVKVSGFAEIRHTPEKTPITQKEITTYTRATRYWQSTDPKIITLAKELKEPQAIYEYVIKNLQYDFGRVSQNQNRLGAVGALNNPSSAVCREFTDLFIAISRAAGIPTREVNGFAYTQNTVQRPLSLVQDVLHSWPEYYDMDKKTWVMVDPTWGATTGGTDYFNVFDFDHFTFARKGVSDSSPIPAGGYKSSENRTEKDVTVNLSKKPPLKENEFKIKSNLNKSYIAGFPVSLQVTIENDGPGSSYSPLYASSADLPPHDLITEKLFIPPYGKKAVDVKYEKLSFLTNTDASITMRFEDKKVSEKVSITPFFFNFYILGGITIGILTIIILINSGKSRRLRLFR